MSIEMMTPKQKSYILHLQGKLGWSTSYIDEKAIFGKNKVGGRAWTKALASQVIDKLKKQIDE